MLAPHDDRPPRGSKRLVHRLLQIRTEYLERRLRGEAAWQEAMAALREMDRRNGKGSR